MMEDIPMPNNDKKNSRSRPTRQDMLWIMSIALIYFIMARASLNFLFKPAGIAAIWPLTGVFLSAVLLTGKNIRPHLIGALFLVDLAAEILAGIPVPVSIIYSLALAGDAALGAWLMNRFVGETITFQRSRDFVGFLFLTVILSNALMSLAAASAANIYTGSSFWSSWLLWFSSDGLGSLLVTPFIMSFAHVFKTRVITYSKYQMIESAVLIFSMVIFNDYIFIYFSNDPWFALILDLFSYPFMIWAAVRFDVTLTSITVIILAGVILDKTVSGQFSISSGPMESIIFVQAYLAMVSVPSILLASMIAERRLTEKALHDSEYELKKAQQVAQVGNWKWDIKRNTVTWSDEMYRIFGIGKAGFSGSFDEVVTKAIHPEDRARVIHSNESVRIHKKPIALEYRVIWPDNSVHAVWSEAGELIEDINGNPVFLTGIAQDITERKKAEHELSQRVSLSFLESEIVKALTRGEPLNETLQRCCEIITAHLEAAFSRIWTLDQTRNMLILQASAGMYTHIDGIHSRIPVGRDKVGTIAKEQRPYVTNNVLDDPLITDKDWVKKEGIVSFAGYPLIVENNLVGVMGMFARRQLPETVLLSLSSIADNIALGIQRKRAERFAARRNRQLLVLSRAAQNINDVLEINAILRNLVSFAMEITESTAGAAGLIIDEKMVFTEYNDSGNISPINYVFEKGYGVSGHVMETGLPYISNDAENDPYVIQEIRNILRFYNLVNVPIIDRKGKILGCFQIHNKRESRNFDQLDVEMLQGLASSAAIALENASIVDRIKKAEEEKRSIFSILDKSLNEIYMFDARTLRFMYVNSGACKNLGYTLEEMMSMTPLDIKPEFDEYSFRKLLGPLMRHEKNKILFNTEHRRRDGSFYPAEVHVQLIEPSNLFLAIIIDITERRRTEKELELSEERYRILYETMAQGVVYQDASGEIISANPAAERILGLSLDQMMGRTSVDPVWKAIHEDGSDFPGDTHPAMVALRTRKKVTDVVMGIFNRSANKYAWILVNAVPQFRYGETKPYQVYTTFNDITEFKQIDDKLRSANEELKMLNRIISTTTGVLNMKNMLETVLDESLMITGLEGGTICFVKPEGTLELASHRATSEATIHDLTTNKIKIGDCLCGAAARDQKTFILPDKESVLKFATRESTRNEDIRYHAAFPLITGGKCVGVLCVFTRTDKKPDEKKIKLLEIVSSQIALSIQDAQLFSETREYMQTLEQKVAQRTVELEENQAGLLNLMDDMNRTATQLEAANRRLLELDRMKSMFIAGTSHELRTPLNSIIGFTSILIEGWSGELTPEQKEQIQIVNNSGKHLLSLINDVIDISKIEAGKLEIHSSKFNIKEVIEEVVSTLKPEIIGKELNLYVEPGDTIMKTDRKRLLQCVLNLLSNAVKFTETGEIKIIVKSINNELEISVIDSGIGIKKEDIPKLFAAFVRLESPLTTKTSGTGLGLYLTQKLTKEVLGGTINVQSEYGKGSIFILRIPKEVEI